MGATTPAAFDPEPLHLGLVMTFIAESAILAGQIVGHAANGLSRNVVPATNATAGALGVALHSQATAGQPVSVAMNGSVVKIMLSADDGTADAGDWIGVSTVAGMGIVRDPAIHAHDAVVGLGNAIGIALDDISAGATGVGGKGYIMISVSAPWTASS
jgi:hypothetical protein